MKAVLDVGQFVSATIQARGHPAQILAAWRAGRFELVTSLPILDDLRRVLYYPRIRKRHRWSDEEIELFVDSIALAATLTPGQLEVNAIEDDPSDNKVLSCAIEGQVDYIVASDKHLTKLKTYAGIPIIRPRRFLKLLVELGEQKPKEQVDDD
ncbi:MAG TPA: putative toxin-antitoxin system toxin component, PIN family [Caldilineae bacterium]|nr:putative toxin-antitoxin system toxin component, PIN family [Caldilineae bacterium]